VSVAWFRDPQARRLLLRGYVPWLAGLNLAWEIAQLPLYTLWSDASPAYAAFAVLHCTAGDVMIGMAALALALTLGRAHDPASWQWRRLAAIVLVIGVGYTVFSEWRNTSLWNWTYSALMPTLELGGWKLGLSPLLQWLIIPPVALYLAKRRA